MNDIAISVKNLYRKYQLYDSPQHRLKEALYPFRKKYYWEFWALKDVLKKGESLISTMQEHWAYPGENPQLTITFNCLLRQDLSLW